MPLDGAVRNYLSFYLHGYLYFVLPAMPEERRKTIWSELESNPGPLASQATALTIRPCLRGFDHQVNSLRIDSAYLCFFPASFCIYYFLFRGTLLDNNCYSFTIVKDYRKQERIRKSIHRFIAHSLEKARRPAIID